MDLTWGRVDYHQASLENLQEAMRRTRRLCCCIVDVQVRGGFHGGGEWGEGGAPKGGMERGI